MVSLLCTPNYIMIKSRIKFPQLLIAFLKEETKMILSCVQMTWHYKIREQKKYLGLVEHDSKLLQMILLKFATLKWEIL